MNNNEPKNAARKDTEFFDKESPIYSAKRYVEAPTNYTQYFFGRRLKVILDMVAEIAEESRAKVAMPEQKLSLLEVGCADGIIMKKIAQDFPTKFASMTGIDISPKMIDVAKRDPELAGMTFMERKDFVSPAGKDVIIEIGTANYADIHEELSFASSNLVTNGFYILSLDGKGSIWSWLVKGKTGYNNFLSYKEYERLISENFEILKVAPVGLFILGIWKVPALARVIQPIKEAVNAKIFPGLFHEKVYLLRKKS